jgi:hypothetical protein
MKSDADRDLIAAVSAVRRGEQFASPQALAKFRTATAVPAAM